MNTLTPILVCLIIAIITFFVGKSFSKVIKPTSEEILKAYKTNEMAANKRFKGQQLLVSGKIDSIEADVSDNAVITFKTADQYEFLKPRASLNKVETEKATTLSKGQNIKLLCSDISEIAGMPHLKKCVIQ